MFCQFAAQAADVHFDRITRHRRVAVVEVILQRLDRRDPAASQRQMLEQLHLSEKTIKHYMTNILQKLHVSNRVEAALLAQKSIG